MSSIAELLKEFSQESSQEEIREENIEEGQVGAEEITVVTDETTTELEEAIEEVAEAVEEQEKVAETTETLLDAAESLENAVAQIEELRLSGQRVNAVSMKIWARGVADSLEARQIPVEVYQDLMDDFGTSFESTDTYSDYSVEAEEKGEGIMTKIWNMIKSAFARARDFLARLIGWFGKSADAIIKAGYKLKDAAKDIKELKDPKAKVNGTPYADLAEAGTKVVPSSAVKTGMLVFKNVDELCNQLYESAINNANALKAGNYETPKDSGLDNLEKSMSGGRVGATRYEPTATRGSSWWDEGKLKLKFKAVKSETSPSKEQNPMSVDDIKRLADEIISAGEGVKARMDLAKRTQGKLNIDFPKTDEGKNAVEKMKERRIIARRISSKTALASSVRSMVSKNVLGVAKKAYVYGMTNVRLYK